MAFLQGFFVGVVVAWAPGVVLMSYLVWRMSRGRASVGTSSEATSQLAQAKVHGRSSRSPSRGCRSCWERRRATDSKLGEPGEDPGARS
jgi:hypothetical protein